MSRQKKIFLITGVLLLSACSFLDLKTSLEKDMAAKDLSSRLSVLEKACTTHASHHHGRKGESSGGGNASYKLSVICHDMGIKITEADHSKQPQLLKKAFSGLVAQCFKEGGSVQYYKRQSGVKTRPGTPSWPFYNLDNERDLTRDAEAICSLYQSEFDKAVKRGAK